MIWFKRAIALLAALAVVGALFLAIRPKPLPVDLATVARGDFEQTVDDDGWTRVRQRYTIAAPLAGKALRIDLKPGDAVAEGAPVATIVATAAPILDARMRQELEHRVGAAEAAQNRAAAAVMRARSTLDQARADLDRTRKLAATGVAARSRLEHDELAAKVAARELDAAQFEEHRSGHELDQARAALANPVLDERSSPFIVRSPVPGRVFRVVHESEGPVAIGTPLLEVGDPHDLEIVVDVLSEDAVAIASGAPARIERWGGERPLDGRVRLVEPSAFTKVSALGVEEQRVNVVIDIVSPPEAWATLGDGFRVDARIRVFEAQDVLKVPTAALFREGQAWQVFVDDHGVARKRAVDLIRRTGWDAVIGSGLAEGESVVLYPGESLTEGSVIAPR